MQTCDKAVDFRYKSGFAKDIVALQNQHVLKQMNQYFREAPVADQCTESNCVCVRRGGKPRPFGEQSRGLRHREEYSAEGRGRRQTASRHWKGIPPSPHAQRSVSTNTTTHPPSIRAWSHCFLKKKTKKKHLADSHHKQTMAESSVQQKKDNTVCDSKVNRNVRWDTLSVEAQLSMCFFRIWQPVYD